MIFQDLTELEQLAEQRAIERLEERILPVQERSPYRGPLRSALMVSGHRLPHLNKLPVLEADVAVLNLEDGVAPEQKVTARYLTALFLSRMEVSPARGSSPRLVVRVNPLGEGGEEDIALMNRVRPHAIRIPKVENSDQVRRALDLVDPSIQLDLSIETASAFSSLSRLRVEERVFAFYLGILDLFVSFGFPRSLLKRDNPTVHYILSRFLVESRAAGAHPFSFVYQSYRDDEGFAAWCELERSMGYVSRGCISPGQVSIVNRFFGTDPEELEKARYVVERFEAMSREGVTGFVDERLGFVDEPIYRDALALLARNKEDVRSV